MNYEQAVAGFLMFCGAVNASGPAQEMMTLINAVQAKYPKYAPAVAQWFIKFYLSMASKYGAKLYQRKGITLPGYTPAATVPLSEMTDEQVIAMLRPYYTRYVETLGEAA